LKNFVHPSAILCVTFCLFTIAYSFAQPVADFAVSLKQICNSVQAQFTDLSAGNPTSWFWNFGDGQTSTAQNPFVVYAAPGVYSVSL